VNNINQRIATNQIGAKHDDKNGGNNQGCFPLQSRPQGAANHQYNEEIEKGGKQPCCYITRYVFLKNQNNKLWLRQGE
jgi:hypothetical protein